MGGVHRIGADGERRARLSGWRGLGIVTVYGRVPDDQAHGGAHVWDPDDVRRVRFAPARRLRRGLDPRQVYSFLAHLATVLEARDRQIRAVWAENDRLKAALRSWQSSHGPRPGDDPQGAAAERPAATGLHPRPPPDVPAHGHTTPPFQGHRREPRHRWEG